jgi:hypothetical protein
MVTRDLTGEWPISLGRAKSAVSISIAPMRGIARLVSERIAGGLVTSPAKVVNAGKAQSLFDS